MSISESERRVIYDSLETNIGLPAADFLMKLIPYPPVSELATRADMHAETTMLRGEMAELRSDLRGEMAELRADVVRDMTELRSSLN